MRTTRRGLRAGLVASLAVLLTGVALLGCGSKDSGGAPDALPPSDDDGGGGGGGGDGGTLPPQITLTVTPGTITAGAAGAQISARVTTSAGAAESGKTVSFTVDSAATATLSAASAVTDGLGSTPAIVLTGKKSGAVNVTARVTTADGTASKTASVTVRAPTVTIAETDSVGTADDGIIAAGTPSSPGASITVTVTDGVDPIPGQLVTFTKTLGDLDVSAVTTDQQGKATAKLTSTKTGPSLVSATVLGASTSSVTVTIQPGPVSAVTLTPSPDRVAPNGVSALAVAAADEFGNPVEGTASFVPDDKVAPDTVSLTAGKANATFSSATEGTFSVTATVQDPSGASASKNCQIRVEARLEGQPDHVRFTVSDKEITVKGGGGTEVSTIDVDVLDINGDPIADVANNIEFKIVSGPAGVKLDGAKGIGEVLTRSTSGGSVSVNLQSGNRPGTAEIQVSVVLDRYGNPLVDGDGNPAPLTANVPKITVRSGEPASLFLTASNAIQSPGLAGNGSITHEYKAFLQDLWGNAVPDGTIVFFGQFLDILRECRNRSVFDPEGYPLTGFRDETCAGASAGTITPGGGAGARFEAGLRPDDTPPFAGIQAGDTLAILSDPNPKHFGAYRIKEVDPDGMYVILDNDFDKAYPDPDDPSVQPSLEWAVGNNAISGGAVFTTENEPATKGGVATWSNTYAGELVNRPDYVYAEASGGNKGHARSVGMAWKADTGIVQLAGPSDGDEVRAGTRVSFSFYFEDASTPTPYAIPGLLTAVSVSGGRLDATATEKGWVDPSGTSALLETSPRVMNRSSGGYIAFSWTLPLGALSGDEFQVWISGGGQVQKLKLTIK